MIVERIQHNGMIVISELRGQTLETRKYQGYSIAEAKAQFREEFPKSVFLNWKGGRGRETVDEFQKEAGQTEKEFRKYVSQMIGEYRLAGMDVYKSSRPCANWG